MRLLLDTHVFLWALGDPARLPDAVAERIQDRKNELLVSAITAFELSTKHRLGKLDEATTALLAYNSYLAELGAKELPVTSRHALVAGRLEWHNRDPFDRILAAQSILDDVALITRDTAFRSVGGVRTEWD